jgi:eukaryotic-like serine/threonine-protein kinase
MVEQVFKLFVSSPADVSDERLRVDLVIDRLNAEFRGFLRFEAIRWETSYYSAHETFQKQIPEAAACDLVIAIFRARLGTALPSDFATLASGEPYPSGAAYEVLSAMQARQNGSPLPDIYVFRYAKPPFIALDEADELAIRDQWNRLKNFFDTWFRTSTGEFLAAFQEFSSTDHFAVRLEDCLRQWLLKRGFSEKSAKGWDRRIKGSPFRGLEPFDADHSAVFFGRSGAVDACLARLREAGARGCGFLLILGASGAGKSSLIRAGLLPRMILPGAIPEIDLWRPCLLAPVPDLWSACADALFADEALGRELRQGDFNTPQLFARLVAASPEAALAPIRTALDRAAAAKAAQHKYEAPRPARIAIALDQAERLFTETAAETAGNFVGFLKSLVEEKLAYVVCGLRSDAYPQFQSFSDLVSLKTHGASFDLLAPSRSELEEMVTKPVEACRPPLDFERSDGRSLAEALVEDARGGDALPLLQMTLESLFLAEAARSDGVLRFVDYPGMDLAVTRAAEGAIGALGEGPRSEVLPLVTQMINDIATDPVTRELVPVISSFDRDAFEAGDANRKALVDAMLKSRLLTAGAVDGASKVRPVHEALLRAWPVAADIVKENASLIRIRRALEPIVREWSSAYADVKTGYLKLPPALLSGAQELLARLPDGVSDEMRQFIRRASEADEQRRALEREDQERRIRDAEALANARRRTITFSLIGLAVALVLAATAGFQWYNAEQAREDALTDLYIQEEDSSRTDNANIENAKLLDGMAQSADATAHVVDTLLKKKDYQSALTIAQTIQPVLKNIRDTEPDNAQVREEEALNDEQIGDALSGGGQQAAAQTSYGAALADWEAMAEADPGNAEWQIREVIDLTKLAGAGADSKANLTRALNILQGLSRAGRLPDYAKNWIQVVTALLALHPKTP